MTNEYTTVTAAVKYEAIVQDNGRIVLHVPFQPGKTVTIFVIQEQPHNAFVDFMSAAESSTDFWDNQFDDEDWNNA